MLKRLTTIGLIFGLAVPPCALHAAETAPGRPDSTAERTLDLRAPEIGRLFSLEQINAVLSRAVDPTLEHVEVEALRLGDLPFEDNSASPTARLARTAAWLFTPSATFAARANRTPDATDPHRPPPFLQANYHASFDQP